MAPIRILLANLPLMLREIVMQAIAGQPDMTVVTAPAGAELADAVRAAAADVAIIPLDAVGELRGADAALYGRPRVKVIGISRDGRDSYIRELSPRTLALGNVGPDELAEAIRRAGRQERAGC